MAATEGTTNGPTPNDRHAIGISFGNSNSSISIAVDDKAEVIANEDGGKGYSCLEYGNDMSNQARRSSDPSHSIIC